MKANLRIDEIEYERCAILRKKLKKAGGRLPVIAVLNKMPTSNNITLLRHIAAILVLINHSFDLMGRSESDPISLLTGGHTSSSRIGLIFFFFISGLLITQSLFSSDNIKHFLWKRILRIYPALIVVVLMTVFVLGPLFTRLPVGAYFSHGMTWEYLSGGISLIRLRFFLPDTFNENGVNGSLWSLPIEFRFYILLAIFFVAGILKNGARRTAIILFILVVYLFYGYLPQSALSAYFGPYVRWSAFFFLGSYVYFFREKIKMSLWILLALLILWYLMRNIEMAGRFTELICFSYMVLFLSYHTPVIGKNFFSKNDFSYSIYIYAFPIQQMILHCLADKIMPWGLAGLTAIALVPFCYFSWRYIEKPASRLKHVFSPKGLADDN
ncbi:MAG: acyltransferase [Chitinophagaceae bacterium]|nr:acyltransferase [Chitinophagaceae bacterium]